jgi:hypothetical protein
MPKTCYKQKSLSSVLHSKARLSPSLLPLRDYCNSFLFGEDAALKFFERVYFCSAPAFRMPQRRFSFPFFIFPRAILLWGLYRSYQCYFPAFGLAPSL